MELRRRTRYLVTIGACATAGGIQALRNWGDHDAFRAAVYAHPEWIHSLARSTPIAEHVTVDAELRGCPIDPGQLVELLTALTTGRRPQLRDEAVCMECKRRGVVCVMVSKGMPCLGQVTQTGCGAICPRFGRGCYGCFGPREQANAAGLTRHLQMAGDRPREEVGRLFAGFTAYSEPFRSMVTELGGARTGRGRGDGRPSRPATDGRQAMSTADEEGRSTSALYEVGELTRVEGEGSLRLRVRDGEVVEARLGIFETPRYFEQLVVGRTPDEVIDIVARICGICPVAYQMSAVARVRGPVRGPHRPVVARPAPPLLLRRVDREPRPPHLPPPRPRLPGLPERASTWRPTTGRSWSRRCG